MWRGLAIGGVVVAAFAATLIAKPIAHDASTTGALTILLPFAAVVGLCLWGQTWPPRRSDTMPLFLAAAALSRIIGQGVHIYYAAVIQRPLPVVSVADVFQLACYPLVLAAIFGLPVRPISRMARTRIVIDGVMVLAAGTGLSWYLILGPTVLAHHQSFLQAVVATSYPTGDTLLFLSVFFLAGRAAVPDASGLIRFVALSIWLVVVADSVYMSQLMEGVNAPNAFIDLLWAVGWLGGAAGARGVRRVVVEEAGDAGTRKTPEWPLWRILLPYALVPAMVTLIVYSWSTDGPSPRSIGVLIAAGAVVGASLLRQALALLDNRALYRQLDLAYQEAMDANARLAALSTTDPLTGLPNHRALNRAIEQEIERAERFGRPFSLLFVDLDHFKSLNDAFGHGVGDTALRELAEVVRAETRAVDLLGRWGGEEFLAILPETSRAAALSLAERLRAAIAAHAFGGGIHHLTGSIGVATFPDDGVSRDELVALSDAAMYAAKRQGRNQVCDASDPAVRLAGDRGPDAGTREETELQGIVAAMEAMIDARHCPKTHDTAEVAALARDLALELGLDARSAQSISLAARLHDVGTIAIPEAVLQKPGDLDEHEWELVRTHPDVGAEIVLRVPALRSLAPIVRAHHERWDGQGYPDGRRGEEILIGARILGVAIAFAAMTSDRPYRRRLEPGEALEEIRGQAGRQLDPRVVGALVAVRASSGPGAVRILTV